jgi:hypothetical protein
MSTPTTAVPAATTSNGFWAHLKVLLPAIEMAGNVALLASGVGAPFEPLVAALENATQSAVQSIGEPQTVSTTLMTIYATIIAVLTTLKTVPGLPAATLTTIEGYITAAQNGTAGYVQAQSGYDASLYTPVTPIS